MCHAAKSGLQNFSLGPRQEDEDRSKVRQQEHQAKGYG